MAIAVALLVLISLVAAFFLAGPAVKAPGTVDPGNGSQALATEPRADALANWPREPNTTVRLDRE